MSREKICPVCCNGQGFYYVVVKGAVGLQRRTCPLPHNNQKATQVNGPKVPYSLLSKVVH